MRRDHRKPAEAPLPVPEDVAAALGDDPVAAAAFDRLPPSHRREHLTWVEEAKRPETRARRIEKMRGMLRVNQKPNG